jgi:NADPH2:quinone reductase
VRAYVNTPDGPVLREVDTPSPAADEALVTVEAFALDEPAAAPPRPGHDVAGVVAHAAADGSGPPAGTRVAGLAGGEGRAEWAAVPTAALAAIPDDVPTTAAATLPVAGVTALRTVRLGGSLLGRSVLVTGVGGALGRLQVELAAQSGAAVTAVARAEHAVTLVELGATAVVESVEDAARGFALVLDDSGGTVLAAALPRVAAGGTVVVVPTGASPSPGRTGSVDADDLPVRSYRFDPHDPVGPDLTVLLQLAEVGRLHAPVARTADWTELGTVLDELRKGRIPGMAVLTVR